MKKLKKSKSKKKHKTLTCPHGGKFAKDWFQLSNCEKSCKLAKKCEEVWEDNYFKVSEDEEDEENDRLKRHSDVDEDEKPQSKKHKKRKQDNRGLYIPRPALNKLLALSYHSCVRLYCLYMKEGVRQKTNRPWCNNYFTAKRLKCSIGTVVTAKNLLIKAGFIKIVGGQGEQGRFGKTYIELKYYPSKFVIENEEYKRRLDKYVEEFAEWVNIFTSEKMKLEVKLFEEKEKYKELRRRYRKLKNRIK